MGLLLGGVANPLGRGVQYVEAPFDATLAELLRWRRGLGKTVRVSKPRAFEEALVALTPFEAPWTRELLAPCGDRWTAYLNNFVNGGDITASAIVVAMRLGVRHVVADHSPKDRGMAATQLWLSGPEGEPPLMYIRTVASVCEDGRWAWDARGEVQPFERTERYEARLVRERFDRPLLVEYLAALGIPADDDDAYGPGVVVTEVVPWRRRTVPLDEARRELGLEPWPQPQARRRLPWRR
ncbi:MAG TPA: hypothetical protein VNA20_00450 [Frankiaceae bacterium]|nr:hypothetical protein [Frankiaceae bacterium]